MAKRGQNEGTIFEEKRGRWVASISLGYEVRNGKRRRIRKKFVAETRKDVQERLTEALRKQQRGGVLTTANHTVRTFLVNWLEHSVKPSVRPKTYRSYEQMVRNHIAKDIPITTWKEKKLDPVQGLGSTQLSKLDVGKVDRWLNAKLEAGNSPALVCYLRVVLRVALNDAIRQGLIDRNPAKESKPPHKNKARLEHFTTAETHRLFDAIQGHRLEALFTVALAVGLRHGEALALKWEDSIDFDNAELRVFHTLQRVDSKLQRVDPKSEESRRIVPLPPVCVKVLKAHRMRQEFERNFAGEQWQESGYVFTSSIGTPLIDRNVLRDFHKLLAQAKLPRRRFHDLRHACVSLLLAQGVPDKTIAEIVGHSDVRLTKNVYQHAQSEAKRAALSGMGDFLTSGPVAPSVAPSEVSERLN